MTLDDYENSILGAGMLWGSLMSDPRVTIELVMDGDVVTNALLVKFPVLGGPPSERGYIVTVTVPDESEDESP